VTRDLKRQVAQPAQAEQRHTLPADQPGLAQCAESRPARATKRRGIGSGEPGRHPHQRRRGRHRIIGQHALQRVPEVGLPGTEALAARSAPLAGATGSAQKRDARAVARRPA
jgi:hypothetical protein